MRQKNKFIVKVSSRKIKRLTPEQWITVFNSAEQMASEDPETHERTLFIISALKKN